VAVVAAGISFTKTCLFLCYIVLQVPCNLIMVRVGISRWLALLLVGWGCVATCFALVHNVTTFFTLRLLLGMFESGEWTAAAGVRVAALCGVRELGWECQDCQLVHAAAAAGNV
jgi:MFS family permease